MQIPFVELHKDKCEKVFLDYKLADEQFGIYATEYRAPVIKKGIKTTDIIACIVDEKQKNIYTLIADVKSNISSFSDDLSKGDALITAIKEVFQNKLRMVSYIKKTFLCIIKMKVLMKNVIWQFLREILKVKSLEMQPDI